MKDDTDATASEIGFSIVKLAKKMRTTKRLKSTFWLM